VLNFAEVHQGILQRNMLESPKNEVVLNIFEGKSVMKV
jgi:hypothetical protein